MRYKRIILIILLLSAIIILKPAEIKYELTESSTFTINGYDIKLITEKPDMNSIDGITDQTQTTLKLDNKTIIIEGNKIETNGTINITDKAVQYYTAEGEKKEYTAQRTITLNEIEDHKTTADSIARIIGLNTTPQTITKPYNAYTYENEYYLLAVYFNKYKIIGYALKIKDDTTTSINKLYGTENAKCENNKCEITYEQGYLTNKVQITLQDEMITSEKSVSYIKQLTINKLEQYAEDYKRKNAINNNATCDKTQCTIGQYACKQDSKGVHCD